MLSRSGINASVSVIKRRLFAASKAGEIVALGAEALAQGAAAGVGGMYFASDKPRLEQPLLFGLGACLGVAAVSLPSHMLFAHPVLRSAATIVTTPYLYSKLQKYQSSSVEPVKSDPGPDRAPSNKFCFPGCRL